MSDIRLMRDLLNGELGIFVDNKLIIATDKETGDKLGGLFMEQREQIATLCEALVSIVEDCYTPLKAEPGTQNYHDSIRNIRDRAADAYDAAMQARNLPYKRVTFHTDEEAGNDQKR